MIRLRRQVKKFKPDLFLSMSSPYASILGSFYRKPVLTFEDTEYSPLLHRITRNFSTHIITGTSFQYDFGPKQIRIPFYKELAWLHPDVFQPDPRILEKYGLSTTDKFVLIRLVGKHTIHEKGRKGLDDAFVMKCNHEFKKHARVLISSEHSLPPSLQSYELSRSILPSHTFRASDIHHLEHFATLLFGESSTMAAEAAILGTPAIYIDKINRGYCEELEKKYGLLFHFTEEPEQRQKALTKALEILNDDHFKEKIAPGRTKMLSDKIDVNSWTLDFIHNFAQKS